MTDRLFAYSGALLLHKRSVGKRFNPDVKSTAPVTPVCAKYFASADMACQCPQAISNALNT